ncbi:MAG TPA: hypothetical protein VGO58_08475 [Chitinophagaceae bacterium]|jgi:hypothetical protein|nr:hypothetical protein [Chitinophagaceae bacterium]
MNVQINQLVRSLLQKDDIGQCSLQELQQFAEKNPYFGAAQLLLTKKMQTEAPAQYDEQLQKTFLFFNNPLWVEQVLNGTGKASITPAEKKPEPVPVLVSPEQMDVMETIPEELTREEEVNPEPVLQTETIAAITEPSAMLEEAVAKTEESPAEPPLLQAEPFMALEEAVVKTEALPLEVTKLETEPVAVTTEPVALVEEPLKMEEPPLEIPTLNTDQPVTENEPVKDELLFEPYHTVDYFASQGIRFKEEERPTDKFGKQLKSFTDWLKSMKRLPVSEIVKKVETAAPVNAEKKVEQLAEHSLAEGEVVTEAMAEVWEKQGNTDKAIGVYRKLSLLDPSKSPYFAAKISALNK